ncbi:MAG: NAD(P)/FAD-dependent oxidoreductase [Candidatus Marinimicrobia bacterium]|nr:NAD(P)/FAD-dependent oxidoreductase [Candidatus Neomarinimicrobiota bacterium]
MAEAASNHFDVLIIGAGPGGMAAATRGAIKGLKIGLVNGQRLWGQGIHGAYKSKGMYELAKDHRVATKPGRGYMPAAPDIDFRQVQTQLLQGAAELESMYEAQIEMLNITEIRGMAVFVDRSTISIKDTRYTAKDFIIATGTTPKWIPSIQRDNNRIMTSDEIVSLSVRPDSLLILGAGVIGCEFASIFNIFGAEVTLLDAREKILAHEDDDIGAFLTENFRANGIAIIKSAKMSAMLVEGDQVVTTLEDGSRFRTDAALVSVGRTPNTKGLGLGDIGVKLDAQGYIKIDENCGTTVEHIYAVGDVGRRENSLDLSLVHVAEAEGHQAIGHILGGEPHTPMSHIPFIIFTIPLIAGAGESEKSAREKYGDVRVAKLNNVRNHRAHAMRSFAGFVKLIVGPEGDDRILGVRACGPQADTLIGEVSLCIQYGLPYTHLMDAVHAHPSLSESLHNAARMLAGLYPIHD